MALAKRPRGKNTTQLQLENRSTLLKLLRQNKHACRKDLAEMSGLTGAAVTNLIRDLMEVGLVTEDLEYTGPLNRNAVPLRINFEEFLVIGMTIRRGRLSHAVSDLSGSIIEQGTHRFGLDEPVENVLTALTQAIAGYVEKYSTYGRIVGIGLSAPGPLNLEKGEISFLTNAPRWKAIPIKRYLRERFDFPVVMDENANAAALAEKWFGCGKDHQNLISILVGKGVGAGVVLGGEIYHGAFGLAGEVGHVSIDYDGTQCDCGNRGCLELYCSTLALVKRAQEIHGVETARDFGEIVKLVKGGDVALTKLVIESGHYLGYAIVNLVNAFNPELIVLHGEMAEFGQVWLDTIKDVVKGRLLPEVSSGLKIEFSALVEDPVLLGTVAMVCEYLFDDPCMEHFTGVIKRKAAEC